MTTINTDQYPLQKAKLKSYVEFKRTQHNFNLLDAVADFSREWYTPIVVVYHFAIELYGPLPELVAGKMRTMDFYRIDEVV